MLNQVYDISVNFLWECIFGPTEFCYKYWDSRKFYDFKITEWKPTEKYIRTRTLTYIVDLGTFGHPKNIEEQVNFWLVYIFTYKKNIHNTILISWLQRISLKKMLILILYDCTKLKK